MLENFEKWLGRGPSRTVVVIGRPIICGLALAPIIGGCQDGGTGGALWVLAGIWMAWMGATTPLPPA